MKILLISSLAIPTPPSSYGGLERVVYEYAWGLKDLGHDVALVGAKGSQAPPGVELLDTLPSWDSLSDELKQEYSKADFARDGQPYWFPTGNGWRAHEEASFQRYKDVLDGFDVVGDHSWAKWSLSSKKAEIVSTLHSQKSYNVKPPRDWSLFTAVSHGHARFTMGDLHVPVRVLHNPVNANDYPFRKEKGDRILSLNRIMATKGIHHFVDLCESQHLFGDVAGDDSKLVPDQSYVSNVKRRCEGSAYLQYHGLVSEEKRKELLANAKCLVCFKDGGYEEVFGLNLVEALACGTPVLSVKTWGAEDIIELGKSGYIFDSIEELVKLLPKVKELNPEDCRARAKFFSRHNRSVHYAGVLETVKKGSRW